MLFSSSWAGKTQIIGSNRARLENIHFLSAGRAIEMGQLESVAFDNPEEEETTVLNGDRSLHGVASAIREGRVKKICVLTGAGISCNAGIPDFRSPVTGIYNNLEEYHLPTPESMFELAFFRENPAVFYRFMSVRVAETSSLNRPSFQESTNPRMPTTS